MFQFLNHGTPAKVAEFTRTWFAGTHVYDDEPCVACAGDPCSCPPTPPAGEQVYAPPQH